MGSNHYFFKLIKHVKRNIPKVTYTNHLLSSSSLLKNKEAHFYLDGRKIWDVGQVSETLRKLVLVTLEHGTCFHFCYIWVDLHVSKSYRFHVSSYCFDSFKENLWFSSHYVWFYALLSQCFHVTCHDVQCSREFSASINLCSIIQFHTHDSLSTFSLSSQTTIPIRFVSMMGHTSWPSFDESVPVDINSII
jgi:hypothetical protein